jgi:hypothetical protein
MSTFAKVAVAAVAVIAVGLVGMTFLQPGGNGGVGAPSAAPSPAVVPTAPPDPTAPPLTGQFTSPSHGYTIASPEGWSTRAATAPWTSGIVDYFNEGSDLIYPGTTESPGPAFLALASQALGDRTPAEFEADVWQILIDDDPVAATCSSSAEPITIDGATGSIACKAAVVADGGRGYVVMLWTVGDEAWIEEVYDDAWLASVVATMDLQPEDAVDAVTSSAPTAPPLTGAFTSPSHGYTISYPDTWETRPATAPWTTQWVDWFNESGDLLHDAGAPGALFLSLASQPLGDRTRAEWEADVDEILAVDDPAGPPCSSAAAQITIDGAPGIRCGNVALVTEGGRGYWIMLYTSNDGPWLGEANEVAWFESVLATMELHPEDAVDAAASPAPS